MKVIDGTFASARGTVVNIFHWNTDADGTIKARGYKAFVSASAAHLDIGEGAIHLSNSTSGRALLAGNLTGNITVNGVLRVDKEGGGALPGSSANFGFKAGVDTQKGAAAFNNDTHLGKAVDLKAGAHAVNFKGNACLGEFTDFKAGANTASFKDIDANKGGNGTNATTLDFRNVIKHGQYQQAQLPLMLPLKTSILRNWLLQPMVWVRENALNLAGI